MQFSKEIATLSWNILALRMLKQLKYCWKLPKYQLAMPLEQLSMHFSKRWAMIVERFVTLGDSVQLKYFWKLPK